MKTPHNRTLPAELAAAWRADPKARTAFDSMPPSHQAEYVKYISQAKQPTTRQMRASKSIEMIRAWAQKRAQG